MFRRRSRPKPSFATATGKGSIAEYKYLAFSFQQVRMLHQQTKEIEIDEQFHPFQQSSWLHHQPCISHTNLYKHSISISVIYITNHLELAALLENPRFFQKFSASTEIDPRYQSRQQPGQQSSHVSCDLHDV